MVLWRLLCFWDVDLSSLAWSFYTLSPDSLPLRHAADHTTVWCIAQTLAVKRGTRRTCNALFHRTVRMRCYPCSFRRYRIYDGKRQSNFQLPSYLSIIQISLFRSLEGSNFREVRQSEPTGDTSTHDTMSVLRFWCRRTTILSIRPLNSSSKPQWNVCFDVFRRAASRTEAKPGSEKHMKAEWDTLLQDHQTEKYYGTIRSVVPFPCHKNGSKRVPVGLQ